jgi:hypothetical protein
VNSEMNQDLVFITVGSTDDRARAARREIRAAEVARLQGVARAERSLLRLRQR